MYGVPPFTDEQARGEADYFLKATGPEIGAVFASWPLAVGDVDVNNDPKDTIVANVVSAIAEMLEFLSEEFDLDADTFNLTWNTVASEYADLTLTARDVPG